MAEFKVIVHGTFGKAGSKEATELGPSGISGFFATRVVVANGADSAGAKAKEIVLRELAETLLRDRADLIPQLDVDDCRKLGQFSSRLPDKGFTFY